MLFANIEEMAVSGGGEGDTNIHEGKLTELQLIE